VCNEEIEKMVNEESLQIFENAIDLVSNLYIDDYINTFCDEITYESIQSEMNVNI
jgi:hypothetical protein